MDQPTPELCRFCKNGLETKSVFCTNCRNFQDWRRFLNFSTTFLALLIALISVSTALGPTLIDLLTTPSSRIVFSVLSHKSGNFVVLARNLGNRPATIGSGELAFHLVGAYPVSIDADTRVIDGGGTEILRILENPAEKEKIHYGLQHMYWFEGRGERKDEAPRSGNLIGLEVIQHDGCTNVIGIEIPKPIFESYLEYYFPSRSIPAPELSEPDDWSPKGNPRLSKKGPSC